MTTTRTIWEALLEDFSEKTMLIEMEYENEKALLVAEIERLKTERKALRETMAAYYRASCVLGAVLDDDNIGQVEWLAAVNARAGTLSTLFEECEKAAAEASREGGG